MTKQNKFRAMAMALGCVLSAAVIVATCAILKAMEHDSEIVMRHIERESVHPYNPTIRDYVHPIYGLWTKPEFTMVMSFGPAGGRPAEWLGVRTDKRSFRMTPLQIPPEKADVWIFGGSILWGAGLRFHQTLGGIIERNFPLSVAYLAQPGGTSENIRRIFDHLLATTSHRPKLVVLEGAINDCTPGPLENEASWQKIQTGKKIAKALPLLYLPAAQRQGITALFSEPLQISAVPLERHLENLRHVAETCQQLGITPSVVDGTFGGMDLLSEYSQELQQHRENIGDFLLWYGALPRLDRSACWFGSLPEYWSADHDLCDQLGVARASLTDGIEKAATEQGRAVRDFFPILPYDQWERDLIHTLPVGMDIGAGDVLAMLDRIGFERRAIPLEANFEPFTVSRLPRLEPKDIPLKTTRHYLSLVVIAEADGVAPLTTTRVFGENSAGGIYPLIPERYQFPQNVVFLANTRDSELIQNMAWSIQAVLRAKIRDGKVVVEHEDTLRVRSLINKHLATHPRRIYLLVIINNLALA